MRADVTVLADYYASPAGRKTLSSLLPRVAPLLRCSSSERLLGLGFAQAFLPTEGPMLVQACPALQGVMRWPQDSPNRSCLVDDKQLPFIDSLFDQVLVVHALEYAEPARRLLRELWRVLAPGGELLLLVPNRGSLHTVLDASPFANGRPFSASQLLTLLRDSLFEPKVAHTAVALPGVFSGTWLDRMLVRALPKSGGIHIVLAQKTDGAAPARIGKAVSWQAASADA
jgi:SAM-dependent methyltransferase